MRSQASDTKRLPAGQGAVILLARVTLTLARHFTAGWAPGQRQSGAAPQVLSKQAVLSGRQLAEACVGMCLQGQGRLQSDSPGACCQPLPQSCVLHRQDKTLGSSYLDLHLSLGPLHMHST